MVRDQELRWATRSALACLVLAAVCGCGDRPQRSDFEGASSDPALNELQRRLSSDGLYGQGCTNHLALTAWKTNGTHIFVRVTSNQNGGDRKPSALHSTVDSFRMSRRTGQWEVEWPAPGKGWLDYYLYASMQGDGFNYRCAGARDPYMAVVRSSPTDQTPAKLTVYHRGHAIYAYEPRHLPKRGNESPSVDSVYSWLDPGDRKAPPEAFDDVLGNGMPDLVVDEYFIGGSGGGTVHVLTVLSLDGTNVVETPPVVCPGEAVFLEDRDGDGRMEIVNRDDGLLPPDFLKTNPVPERVWTYDPESTRYRRTGDISPSSP